MLWLKAFHIIFVVTWFAGLLYLPRLFVYHAEAEDPLLRERFKLMERRLLGITHVGGALAISFGLALLAWWMRQAPDYLASSHWLQLKLVLVAALIGYHGMLIHLTRVFAREQNRHSSGWLRLFNEIPALLLILIVLLVVLKPF